MRKLCFMVWWVLILGSACLPPAAAPPRTPTPGPSPQPTTWTALQEVTCWRALPADIAARCGYVTVGENRHAASSGKTIRLAVMILRQKGVEPTGEPTFLLAGGPGQDAIGLFTNLLGYWDYFRSKGYPKEAFEGQLRDWLEFRASMDIFFDDLSNREFVVIDQRGTGYSEPSLKCHGDAYDNCYARLKSAGIDLSAYNTAENAADVDAIRQALGYRQINLQGGSYGTRLAYEVLRDYGDSVRAVVFDSTVALEMDWYVATVKDYAQNIDVLFDHCAAQPDCRRAYPRLKEHFYALVERLDAAPLPVPGGGHFDGADLLELTWNAMYDIGKIRWLPALIDHTYWRDYRLLQKWGEAQGQEEAGETMAWGMNYSVECAEQWSAATKRAMIEAAEALPPAIGEDALDQFIHMDDVCSVWRVTPLAARVPVKSDTPALFLSGEFDPATPPGWAAVSARNFSHAYRYVFPAMGHTDGFFSRCWASIQSQFLDDPTRAPDASCIEDMPDGEFVVRP